MCYYSKLEGSVGKCRCCLVEVAKGSEADPMPKLMALCNRMYGRDGSEQQIF
jgi:NADH-quinone oxidoreductase subunit G